MPFRLSCRDNSFPALSHRVVLQVLSDLGIDGVDVSVSARHPHITPAMVVEDPRGLGEHTRHRIEEHGLAVADVFALPFGTRLDEYPLNHPHDHVGEECRGQFRSVLEFAVGLGAPGITLLPGIPFEDDQGAFDRAVGELGWRVGQAQKQDVRLSVEPHIGSVAPTPAAALELVTSTEGLELTLDYSHFVAQHIDENEVDGLIPYARHVQARQAAPGRLQVPMRRGTIDFRRVLRRLEDSGYEGFIGIEYVWNEQMGNVDCLSETAVIRDLVREKGGVSAAGP